MHTSKNWLAKLVYHTEYLSSLPIVPFNNHRDISSKSLIFKFVIIFSNKYKIERKANEITFYIRYEIEITLLLLLINKEVEHNQ